MLTPGVQGDVRVGVTNAADWGWEEATWAASVVRDKVLGPTGAMTLKQL